MQLYPWRDRCTAFFLAKTLNVLVNALYSRARRLRCAGRNIENTYIFLTGVQPVLPYF